jgi:uncharacterized protein (TIGR00251 family)
LTRLSVRVSPGAKRDEITGWRGDVLRVRVRAAPEKGKANEAVCALLAQALGVPSHAVRVELGHTVRDKVLSVDGMTADDLASRLGRPML